MSGFDPIRPYSDLQINPWEDSQFFDLNTNGNITTIPVFAGKYEYEFNFNARAPSSSAFVTVSLGPQSDGKILAYFGDTEGIFQRTVNLVISKIETPVPVTVTLLIGGTLRGSFRRRELRTL